MVRRCADSSKGSRMEGTGTPEYGKCEISTAALKEMMLPAWSPLSNPILVRFLHVLEALGAYMSVSPYRVSLGDLPEQRRWCLGQRQRNPSSQASALMARCTIRVQMPMRLL